MPNSAAGAGNSGGGAGSGTGGSGNLAGSFGQAAGAGGQQKPPEHVVTPCDKLAAPGVWEKITPDIDLSTFGAISVFTNPNNHSTVYVGTAKSGLHRSDDCGATWNHVTTGTLGADLEKGSVAPVLDPINPDVLYTGSLYGTNGLFKSTNGGKDWKQILPPDLQQYIPYGGFIGNISMDPGPGPNANLHLVVNWHDVCKRPYFDLCYAETFDGGDSWKLVNGIESWSGMEGSSITFLDSTRWLFGSQANGLWLSEDSGKNWKEVPGIGVSHGAGQIFRAKNGSFYFGSGPGVLFSPNGKDWSVLPNSGGLIGGVVGDGKRVFASTLYPYNPGDRPAPTDRYVVSNESDPMAWSVLATAPKLSSGGYMTYDPDHKLLYSANLWDGVWRVVLE